MMIQLLLVGCFISLLFSSQSMGQLEIEDGHSNKEGPGPIRNGRISQNRISKRSATNSVDIARFTDKKHQIQDYSIYVDSTMSKLIIKIEVDKSTPVSSLLKPSGIPGPHPTLNGTASTGTVTASFDVNISSADYGLWKLKKLDISVWKVTIQGESTVDFSYQFLERSSTKTPIKGDPVQEQTYKMAVTVAGYDQIKTVDMFLVFVTEKFTPADIKMLVVAKGAGKYEMDEMKMLDRDFMIGIQGQDNSSNTFRRIHLIKPVALLLSVPLLTDPATKLYEHTKLEIPFSVTNKLSRIQDIDVKITDTQGLAVAPLILSTTLQPGDNYTGKFVLSEGLLGVETVVTITATPYQGAGHHSTGPSVRRKFTVESNRTTTSTSTTTTSSSTTVNNKRHTTDTKSLITTQPNSNQLSPKDQGTDPASEEKDKDEAFSKEDMFAVASISGVSVGVLIGVAALVTMRLVLKHSMNKKKVEPKDDENK